MIIKDLFEARYPLATDGWYGNLDYKARGGRLVYMTPQQYLSQVRPLDIDDSSRDNIDDLKQHIESGRTLDPLAIYADGKEDGRHRAHAAKELGIRRVPVIDFRKPMNEAVAKSVEDIGRDNVVQRQIYHITGVPGLEASLRILDYHDQDPGRVVQTIETYPETMRGKGYAQQLYLAALADGPINERPQFRSAAATHTVERLISKGMVVRNSDVLTLAQSVNESGASDFDKLGEVQRAAGKFQSWLSRNNEETPVKDCGFYKSSLSGLEVWMIRAMKVGIADHHLYLALGDRTKDNAAGFVAHIPTSQHDGDPVKNTDIVLCMLIGKDPADEIDVAYTINWDFFAHEYVHVLDYRRGLVTHKYNQDKQKRQNKNYERQFYYDRPEEFNAYFQQGLREILHGLARATPMYGKKSPEEIAAFRKQNLSSYPEFRKKFVIWFDSPWLTHLNAANKRKFERRFFKVFNLVQQTWPDMDAINDIAVQNAERDQQPILKVGDVVAFGSSGEICDVLGVSGDGKTLKLASQRYKVPFEVNADEVTPQ